MSALTGERAEMPGIAAIIGPAAGGDSEALVRVMLASMRTSGHEACGMCFAPDVGVHAGWVAHEGSLAASHGSLRGRAGMRAIVAGEWYPHHLATASAGSALAHGSSLLRGYERHGAEAVASLNGLFAGLVIDPQRRRAMLFNDRYGSERLYFHERAGSIYVASEAKALLAVIPSLRAFDDRGVAQFLAYGSTFNGRTLFRGIEVMPAASIWTFEVGGKTTRRTYFKPEEWECLPVLSEQAFIAALCETLVAIVPKYVAGDARLGVSLTGGLDTRMIMACLPQLAQVPVCYTFAGTCGETLDVRLAAQVARECALDHQVVRIGPDFVANYGHHVDRTVLATDGCAGALGAHEIYLSERARKIAPVRLTGNYGSEILRDMSTLDALDLAPSLLEPRMQRQVALEEAETRARRPAHPVTRAAFQEIPSHLFGTLAAARSLLTFRTPYLDNDVVRLAYQAPAAARRSPLASLEVVHRRVPALAAIPTDRARAWRARGPLSFARRAVSSVTFKLDYLYTEGLPHRLALLGRPLDALAKTRLLGLHKFLPYRTWFAREFQPYVQDVLSDPQTGRLAFLDRRALSSLASAHASGRRNYLREMHAALTLEAVDRLLLRGSADARRTIAQRALASSDAAALHASSATSP